jgi:hypothetical protein
LPKYRASLIVRDRFGRAAGTAITEPHKGKYMQRRRWLGCLCLAVLPRLADLWAEVDALTLRPVRRMTGRSFGRPNCACASICGVVEEVEVDPVRNHLHVAPRRRVELDHRLRVREPFDQQPLAAALGHLHQVVLERAPQLLEGEVHAPIVLEAVLGPLRVGLTKTAAYFDGLLAQEGAIAVAV